MCYQNTVHVYFWYQNMLFYFRLQQNIILLNFDISDTDISNTMVMSKWFVSRNNFSKKVFYPRYLKVFKQSYLVWDNKVWLYMYLHFEIKLHIQNVNKEQEIILNHKKFIL